MGETDFGMGTKGQGARRARRWRGAVRGWPFWLVLVAGLLPAAPARGDELVVFPDGRSVRVGRAEVLPDRVRIEATGPTAPELPPGVPFTPSGTQTVDIPRDAVRAVLPQPDPAGAARPHAERYQGITQQLTDQVHRDLQRSWSLPSPAGR